MGMRVGLAAFGTVMLFAVPPAFALDTSAYVEACTADPGWEDEADMLVGSAVTPKMFCQCLAERYKEEQLNQEDVDFLTKLRSNTLTDEEMESYARAEDLFTSEERLNETCQQKLALDTAGEVVSPEDAEPELGADPYDPVDDEPTDDAPGSGPD